MDKDIAAGKITLRFTNAPDFKLPGASSSGGSEVEIEVDVHNKKNPILTSLRWGNGRSTNAVLVLESQYGVYPATLNTLADILNEVAAEIADLTVTKALNQ